MEKCQVELDGAGWSSWPRLTCYTCGTTLLRKPYMKQLQWYEKVVEFANEHPSEDATLYLNRIQTVADTRTKD